MAPRQLTPGIASCGTAAAAASQTLAAVSGGLRGWKLNPVTGARGSQELLRPAFSYPESLGKEMPSTQVSVQSTNSHAALRQLPAAPHHKTSPPQTQRPAPRLSPAPLPSPTREKQLQPTQPRPSLSLASPMLNAENPGSEQPFPSRHTTPPWQPSLRGLAQPMPQS